MNNQRSNQQNNRQNGNHFQYTNNRGQLSRKEQLQRDLRYTESSLIKLDSEIDALGEKGRLLEAAKNAHKASIPFAIAQVALSTIGVKYLPPVARSWYFKHQEYLRAEEALRQHAVTLHYRREALASQIEHIEIMIEMLQYQP